MTTQVPTAPFIGPYPPQAWAWTAPWRGWGAGVVVGYTGQGGGVQVTTEAEYNAAVDADRARALVYFAPPPLQEEPA